MDHEEVETSWEHNAGIRDANMEHKEDYKEYACKDDGSRRRARTFFV